MYHLLKTILESSNSIVFFGGAGVSTESGIPDFRSENGIYKAKNKYGFAPEEIISHHMFLKHPDIFYRFYKEAMIYPDAQPGKAHLALAKLEDEGRLKGIITQNIDGLHQKAGSKVVYELHGSVYRNFCMDCGKTYSLEFVMDPVNCKGVSSKNKDVPLCSVCGGIVRPDVVLYDETLNEHVIQNAVAAIRNADTLIVGGTSLNVYPAAGFLDYFNGDSLVLINRTSTSYDSRAQLVIHDFIGEVLSAVVDLQ